jgi:hypothetical protein
MANHALGVQHAPNHIPPDWPDGHHRSRSISICGSRTSTSAHEHVTQPGCPRAPASSRRDRGRRLPGVRRSCRPPVLLVLLGRRGALPRPRHQLTDRQGAPGPIRLGCRSGEGSAHSEFVLAWVRRQWLVVPGRTKASRLVQTHSSIVAARDPEFDARHTGLASPHHDDRHQLGSDPCPPMCRRHPHRDQFGRKPYRIRSKSREATAA